MTIQQLLQPKILKDGRGSYRHGVDHDQESKVIVVTADPTYELHHFIFART